MVRRVDSPKRWEPKSLLQRVFIKRVRQEMERLHLNPFSLSKREGAPPYRTIIDALAGRDPSLETVSAFADGLGIPAYELLREGAAVADQRHPVTQMPGYAPMLQESGKTYSVTKARDSKRSRR